MNNPSSSTTASSQLDAYLTNLGITYDELLYYIAHHQMGNYFVFAAGALYAYDFVVTFDEEISFAWSARKWWRDGARLVFLVNRYTPFALIATGTFLNTSVSNIPPFVPPPQACHIPPVILFLSLVNFGSVELIFMLRVWILWEKSRRIGILLIVLFLAGIFLGVALVRLNIPYSLPVAQFPSTIVHGCSNLQFPRGAYVYIMGAVMECISFSLLISKVWMVTGRSNPIFSTLIRQGGLYYTIAFLGFVLAIISTMVAELNFPVFRANVMIVMSSISCNYLMIGLRRVDGSLAGGVTEIDTPWEARPQTTRDVTTTFQQQAFARTRDTDSSPWDVELSSRSARSRTDEG